MSECVTLRNPHSIIAALQQRPDDVVCVRVPAQGGADAWQTARDLAEANRVRIEIAGRESTGKGRRSRHEPKAGRESGGHAVVREAPSVGLDELFADAETRAEGRGLWLALDCIQDPHNLGAIIRTAAFFGVQGLLLTEDRAAPLSAVAYDTAAGGMEYVPHSLQTNLSRSLEYAKEAGLWILGTSEHAETDLADVRPDRPWLLVIGNEGKGMRRLTAEHCDVVCSIAPRGGVTSLNASVAAGILIARLA